jgi:trk system potassium uptake protein TrkH
MNWLLLCRMLGMLGMLVGGSMVFSLPWAFPLFGETQQFELAGFQGLLASIVISVTLGAILYLIGRRDQSSILRKEALATVGLGWLFAGLLGSLPFILSGTLRHDGDKIVRMTIADAVFESISGFTTTGASVLTHLETPDAEPLGLDESQQPEASPRIAKLVPRCILFWRSFTHWLGGMGIIVLFVAILGQLGAGGKALMKREVPGPISESVRPRVRETATVMWSIYVGLSVLLTGLLMIEGMTFFDALCHTFGTMATGGFSTYNASLGHFQSPLIEWTIIVFMVVAGTNFTLYYLVLTDNQEQQNKKRGWLRRLRPFYRDPEFKLYLGILSVATLLLSISLYRNQHYASTADAIRHATFATVSITTTTGFVTEDFDQWSNFARSMLVALMFVGGCAGSTGGGIKVVRLLLFARVLRLELESAFRPNVVRPLRIAGVSLDDKLRHEVIVYFSFVLLIFVSSWLLLVAIEPADQWSANGSSQLVDSATAVAATLNNIGPGLGNVGPTMNYAHFAPQSKLLLSLLMLMGRLELFAILVLFVPAFWKTQ